MNDRYCLGEGNTIIDLEQGKIIPMDQRNYHFRDVLSWMDKGNSLKPLNPNIETSFPPRDPYTGRFIPY